MNQTPNSDTNALREYHERTNHSPVRLQMNRHFLDWDIQPRPFKLYRGLEPIPLPRELKGSATSTLDALRLSTAADAGSSTIVDRNELARLLHFSAGITRTKVYPGGHEYHFRAAACTGALYHIDLYLVCGSLPDLEAGVYHFGPHDFALRCLRSGDFRGVVSEATQDTAAVAEAPAILISASTFWRNSWKYQSRAYRHCFWDNGTILANLLAVAAADGVQARLLLGFVDSTISTLLGLDSDREAALSLVTLGRKPDGGLPSPLDLVPLTLATEPLSPAEVDYPAIRAAHAASSLETPEEVRLWREAARPRGAAEPPHAVRGTRLPLSAQPLPSKTIEQTITQRGSSRRFARTAISFEQLSALLIDSTGGVDADYAAGEDAKPELLADTYLVVNAVDGLAPGTYVYDRRANELELLASGDFRRQAGFLDLGQELAADAAVNFYMLADLEELFGRLGNRAYRVAQQDAAIIGGRLYLAAYGLGLGATGLTFFDDDVTAFFSPHAAGKSVMFLMAVGVPGRGR